MPDKKQYINLCLVFIAIIAIPAIQTVTRLLPENRLHGVVYSKPLPELTWDNWYHFRFQPELNDLVEKKFGFRTAFVRLYNQIDYTLFRQPHGAGIVVGKEGYLYEEWFITAHTGLDYIGEDRINLKIRQLKQIKAYFNHRGIELVVMIAPGKAGFYPQFIPDRYIKDTNTTNYGALSDGIREAGIPLIDFNRWFIDMRDSSACPLFPKTGIHWSLHGSLLATDSLSGFISSLLNRPLPELTLKNTHPADTMLYPDNDLEQLMNLIFPLKNLPMCYPDIESQPAEGFNLPSAIVIGDSFFWGMFNIGLSGRIFSDVNFWYYNNTVFPESYTDSLKTEQLMFPEVFSNTDLIILQVNPSNIQDIGWGFPDRVIRELYQPDWQKEYDKMVREYIQAIHNTPEWEKQIIENAKDKKMPVDSLILLNATYMVEQYLLTNDLF